MANLEPFRIFCYPALTLLLAVAMQGVSPVAHAVIFDYDDEPASEYSAAKEAMDDGDYEVAIYKLARLHEQDPGDADILNLLGYSYRKLGYFDEARGYYLQALAIDPEHRGVNEYLGELYLKIGELAKAEERLAVLDKTCSLECSEYTELKQSIEKYKAENGG